MKVLVSIPTYNNAKYGYTIRQTLEGLTKQTHKDFQVLIVYKPSPNDKTPDIIDEFKDKLGIEVIKQTEGYVEEAMNIIFEVSRDYDLLINIDDDVIPDSDLVKDHVNAHKSHERIGVFSGLININLSCHDSFYIVRRILGLYKPLMEEFKGYKLYVNDAGLEACDKSLLKWEIRLGEFNGFISWKPFGANMSLKAKFIGDFKLPGYTIRGFGYESLLMLHYIKQGLHSVIFPGAQIVHLERDSLSRPKSLIGQYSLYIENLLLPYAVNWHGFKINMVKLKTYYNLLTIYSKIKGTMLSRAYALGLGLAIKSIEEGRKPFEVRNELIRIINELKHELGETQ